MEEVRVGMFAGFLLTVFMLPFSVALITKTTTVTYHAPKVEVREALAAESDEQQAPQPVDTALGEIPHQSQATADIIRYIYSESPKHGINPDTVAHTIYCETMFYNVQSAVVNDGKQEQSYGLAQIHLPSHPTVTVEQALTPTFAVDWMLEHWDSVKWYGHDRATDTCTNGITGYWLHHED